MLALVLLAGPASGKLSAQQPEAVKREPQARLESPDRSVKALDLDPEKAKQDTNGQPRAPQPYSSWGLQRNQAQKTSLGAASGSTAASEWEHKNSSVEATARPVKDEKSPLPGSAKPPSKTKYGTVANSHNQAGEPRAKMPIKVGLPQPTAGYPDSSLAAGNLDFSSRLAFDPARKLSPRRGGLKPKLRNSPSHLQADAYCRASALSTDTKQLCAHWQKKRSRSIH
jgi:hypothetical protein